MASATEQLVVELVGRADKLEAEINRQKKLIADASTTGVRGTTQVAEGATNIGEKFGRSTRSIAMATEQMARMGQVGGEGMKQILAQGGEMALLFGGGGAIVGAVGIATLSIVEMFQRSRKEMDETRRKFDESLAGMVKGNDLQGLSAQAAELYSGAGPFAVKREGESDAAFGIRKSGLAAARQEAEQLTAALQRAKQALKDAQADDPNTLKKSTVAAAAEVARLESELKTLLGAIGEVDREYNRTMLGVAATTKRTSEEARNNLSRLREDAAKKVEGLRDEVAKLSRVTLDSKSKSEQFADAIEAWAKKARDAGMAGKELDDHLISLYATLEGLRKEEQLDKISTGLKTLSAQFIKSTESSAKFVLGIQELLNKAKESGMIKPAELPKAAPADDSAAKVRRVASEWASLGRTIIAASQAIGKMDDETAAALQNAATLGEGIARMLSGDPVGGAAQTIASIAALAKTKVHDYVPGARAFESFVLGMTEQIHGSSLATQIQSTQQQFAGARDQVERDFAGQHVEAMREDMLRKLNALEAERIAQLQREHDEQQKIMQEDDEVRRLRATGHAEEADAMAFALAQEREYAQAVKDGADAKTLASMAERQQAEAAEHAADAAQRAADAIHDAALKLYQSAKSAADARIELYDITDPEAAFREQVKAMTSGGGSIGQLLNGFDLSDFSAANIASIKKAIQEFYEQLLKTPEAFDLAGLSVDEIIDILKEFDSTLDGLAETAMSAAQAMEIAAGAFSNSERVFGTDPVKHAKGKAYAYGYDITEDLGDPEAVKRTIAWFQDVFGQLNDAEKAGDKGKQIAEIIEALQAIPFGAGSPGGGAMPMGAGGSSLTTATATEIRTITIEQATRIDSTLVALLASVREFEMGTFARLDALLAAAMSTIITPPQIPFFGALAGSGGAPTFNVHITIYGDVGTLESTSSALSELVRRELRDWVDRELGIEVKNQRLLRGNIVQS